MSNSDLITNPCYPEGLAVPAPHLTSVVLRRWSKSISAL